jgi:hypothetical protein
MSIKAAAALAIAVAVAVAVCIAAPQAWAQAETPPLLEPLKPGEAPKKIALVSAVGAQFQFVGAKYSTGSNLDPYDRVQIDMDKDGLNLSVLRGLDRAVARVQPTSERYIIAVPAANLKGLSQGQRARAVADDLLKRLQGLQERKDWDYIIAVTPRYAHSGTNRMGDKLWGIGAYIYGLESARRTSGDNLTSFEAMEAAGGEDVRQLDGKGTTNSPQFVAPFAYLRFTVYDAKTLNVIRSVDRLDSRKMGSRDCTSNHVYNCFNPKQYAEMIDGIAERSAVAGIIGKIEGRVEVGDTKVVPASAVNR